MPEKKTYRVKRKMWLYGKLYDTAAEVSLMPSQAAQYLRDGVLEDAEARLKPAAKPKAKSVTSATSGATVTEGDA